MTATVPKEAKKTEQKSSAKLADSPNPKPQRFRRPPEQQELTFIVKVVVHAPTDKTLHATAKAMCRSLYYALGKNRVTVSYKGKEILYDPTTPAGGSVEIGE